MSAGIGQSRGNFVWSDGKEKLEVKYDGAIEFTDDDSDVKSLSPGGLLMIKESGWVSRRTVEFRADGGGNLQRRYWVGWSERPFEPEGRQWLATQMPRFIRQTGMGAPARVARILKAKGPSGVLAEISLIEGSWAKRVYFTELLKSSAIDAATTKQVLDQAGREIESDYELASLLISSADKLLVDDATRRAYFDAGRTIQSDYEMRRVYSSAIKRGPLAPDVLAGILEASVDIDSDYEQASLLIDVAKLQAIDNRTRAPFFKALATVGSDYERKRVLSVVAAQPNLTAETAGAVLESATAIGSDYEKATVLISALKSQSVEGAVRAPYFKAVESIGSAYERGRVLLTLVKRTDLSPETVLGVVRATQTMSSNHETSQVLRALVTNHQITGEARDLYIASASRLGDYEEGRALSALVKGESRK
jgi:hypothetical protein